MYCDKSFQSRSSLVQHLHIHIDGNVDVDEPQTICPVSRDCYSYDASKGPLSSHIISCHPDHAKELKLESNGDSLWNTGEDELGFLNGTDLGESSSQEMMNCVSVSSTPICTVKPLPPASTRLVEDLADTVSAIEAICSLNTEPQTLNQVPKFLKHNRTANNMFTDSNISKIDVLENTHRQFELDVQDAEIVVPEFSESDYFSPNPNSIPKTEKEGISDAQGYNVRLRNSTTRSDIESDSGVESVNSHHFQNSPMYSPMQAQNKTYTSPSPSASLQPLERDDVNGENNIVTKQSVNVRQPKQTSSGNPGFEPPSFISNTDYKNNHLDSINAIESNFPDVFGGSAHGEMPSFSDMIEAETLKLFGDDNGTINCAENNFSPNKCNSNDNSASPNSQKCSDGLSGEQENASKPVHDNSQSHESYSATMVLESNVDMENTGGNTVMLSNSGTITSFHTTEDVNEASQTMEENEKDKDTSSESQSCIANKTSPVKRKLSDSTGNSNLISKRAKIKDCNTKEATKSRKSIRGIKRKNTCNKNEIEKTIANSSKGLKNISLLSNEEFCIGDTGLDPTPPILSCKSDEEETTSSSDCQSKVAQSNEHATIFNRPKNIPTTKYPKAGPKSRTKKQRQTSEDNELLPESSPSKSNRGSMFPPKLESCDNKSGRESSPDKKGRYFRTELLNELHRSITADQEKCVVAKTALLRRNGTKPSLLAEATKHQDLKETEIKSNLQTCIDACFPSLGGKNTKHISDGESRHKSNNHKKSELVRSLKDAVKNDGVEHNDSNYDMSMPNGIRNEIEVKETVKQFSEHLKALRKGHEKGAGTSDKEQKLESSNLEVVNTKRTLEIQTSSSKQVQSLKQDNNGYACSKCGRKYQYENFLKVHMKRC